MSKKIDPKNIQNLQDDDDDDDEDEDYVPVNDESSEDDSNRVGHKRKNKDDDSEDETVQKCKKSDEIEPIKEEDKQKADEIWSSFLKDVKPGVSIAKPTDKNKYQTLAKDLKPVTSEQTSATSTTITKKDLFSSVSSKYESLHKSSEQGSKPSPIVDSSSKKSKPSGLASILDKINKQPKISTLEKSKLDWEEFKKTEKIEEDLTIHSKGKQSYLERKAFLERTDLRQFEIEKDLRNKERKQRDAKF